MRRFTSRLTAIVVGVALLAGAGVAFAAWTSSGFGSGPTTAGSSVPLTVTVGSATGLYPTGSVPVGFTVKNNNPYAVTLQNAHPQNFRPDAAHSSCVVSGGVISAADVALTGVLAAGATSPSKSVPVSMSNQAGDPCQGAIITFDLVVTAVSGS